MTTAKGNGIARFEIVIILQGLKYKDRISGREK
jgi:hypothetical protein